MAPESPGRLWVSFPCTLPAPAQPSTIAQLTTTSTQASPAETGQSWMEKEIRRQASAGPGQHPAGTLQPPCPSQGCSVPAGGCHHLCIIPTPAAPHGLLLPCPGMHMGRGWSSCHHQHIHKLPHIAKPRVLSFTQRACSCGVSDV